MMSTIKPPTDTPAVAAITTESITGGSVEGVIAGKEIIKVSKKVQVGNNQEKAQSKKILTPKT